MQPRSAREHARYAEAEQIARRGGFLRWLRSWQDVCAVLDGCYFDKVMADRVITFFQLLRHTRGEWAGKPFELLPWQEDGVIRPLFGWIRADGSRRFRRAYVEVPKKNGKSTLSAGIALYLLVGDGEPGSEVYSAATDRQQASIVYAEAKGMVLGSDLRDVVKLTPSTKSMTFGDACVYRVLSADAGRQEGLNIHGLIFDELHAQKSRALWDALVYGGAARRQPLMVSITTAGYDRNTVCWEEHELARQVIEGSVENPAYFAAIFAADKDADWTAEKTWRDANPSYGITIKADDFREQCADAQASPAKQNAFRRYRLNQWTEQEERWLDLGKWDACAGEVNEAELAGCPCYAGLDLSSTQDITAFVMVFSQTDTGGHGQTLRVVPRFWVPGESAYERELKHGVPYSAWARDGLVNLTDGAVIDYREVLRDIAELGERFNIRQIGYDRWGATAIATELTGEGFTMVQMGQGFATMSAPTKELMHRVLNGQVAHGGNPVLRWMAGNMTVKSDPAGNLKPDKARSSQKIDGMVALIMGLDLATRAEAPGAPGIVVW